MYLPVEAKTANGRSGETNWLVFRVCAGYWRRKIGAAFGFPRPIGAKDATSGQGTLNISCRRKGNGMLRAENQKSFDVNLHFSFQWIFFINAAWVSMLYYFNGKNVTRSHKLYEINYNGRSM